DIHLVDALVAEVAIAGIPHPVPIVVELLAGERLLRGGSAPEIVIESFGDRLFAFHFADAGAALVADATGPEEFTEVAFLSPFRSGMEPSGGAALRACLDDALVFARGFDQLAAFEDIVGNRLLHIDILARLRCPDAGQG